MPLLPSPLRALLVVMALSTAATEAASIPSIFERQSTCSAEQTKCPAGLPNNFCCPKGQTCLALAANTTILCCPNDIANVCRKIQPISCDVSLQDVGTDSQVKTTFLTGKLPTCGAGLCCPFGFTCNNNECIMDKDQTVPPVSAAKPSASAPPASTPTTSTSTGPPTSRTSTPGEAPKAELGQEGNGGAFPTTGVIVGVLVGVLGGIALTAAIFLWLSRRRRQNKDETSDSRRPHGTKNSSTSSFGNFISEPILHGNTTLRSDFILKTPSSQGTTARAEGSHLSSSFRPRESMVSNLSDDAAPQQKNAAVPPIRGMRTSGFGGGLPDFRAYGGSRPVTPQLQRQPSSESISVFADPHTVGRSAGERRDTTWTGMMVNADLGGVARGEPFVPLSAQNSPSRH